MECVAAWSPRPGILDERGPGDTRNFDSPDRRRRSVGHGVQRLGTRVCRPVDKRSQENLIHDQTHDLRGGRHNVGRGNADLYLVGQWRWVADAGISATSEATFGTACFLVDRGRHASE